MEEGGEKLMEKYARASKCQRFHFLKRFQHQSWVSANQNEPLCLSQSKRNGSVVYEPRCRANEGHVILQPNARARTQIRIVRLGQEMLQPKYKHDLHPTRALPSTPQGGVGYPPVIATLPKPGVAGLPLCSTYGSKWWTGRPGCLKTCRTKSPPIGTLQVYGQDDITVHFPFGRSRNV